MGPITEVSILRNMQLDMVAVIPSRRSWDHIIYLGILDLSHSLQLVDEYFPLDPELVRVVQMLIMATSTFLIMNTARVDPVGRWLDDLNHLTPGIALLLFYKTDLNFLVWKGIGNENCPTIWQSGKNISTIYKCGGNDQEFLVSFHLDRFAFQPGRNTPGWSVDSGYQGQVYIKLNRVSNGGVQYRFK
jgi:hypothetical protein